MMRCWLIDATRMTASPEEVRPLGTRTALISRIVELLPGTSFDGDGRGVFRRGTYTVTFTLADSEPGYVDVEIDRAEGLTVIARVVEKTGWQVVDPLGPMLIDVAASRAAGRFVHKADSVTVKATRNWRVPAFAGAGLVAVAVVGWFATSAAFGDGVTHEDGFDWSTKRLTARHDIVAQLPQELRENAALVRVIDFALAEQAYHDIVGGRFATPVRMMEGVFWQRKGMRPVVPKRYGDQSFEGYEFTFHGKDCESPDAYDAPKECESFVYLATPFRARELGHARPPAFALYSADMRIRYRDHGEEPEADDDAIDTRAPASGASLATASGAFSGIGEIFSWFTGSSAAAEASALRDLREVAKAEALCREIMSDDSKYMAPEQLADSAMFARAHIPEPFLPSRFLHPQRDGYSFEFIGEGLTTQSIHAVTFHPVYQRFVYLARPLKRGARTMALYQDGRIFAAIGSRRPTPDDEEIDGR
jgi:hypothetical protein